ncbi:uncharacterized protein LOC123291111 [Chrysoperla carnea]|uniref:uncharacterized protein LOC123291111 n=1 Tax=Chrysoperla carnea TaxID=189513 RepID=UPI001D080C8E|nr:uncharacterized protein LOC123291111 [Chrysoperla carnea]
MKFVLFTLFITITIVNIVNCHEESIQNHEPLSIQESKQDNLQPALDSKDVLLKRLTRTFQKGGGYSGGCNTCQVPVQQPVCNTCGGGGGGSRSYSQASSQASSSSSSYGKKK